MAQIFSKKQNTLVLKLLAGKLLGLALIAGLVWYYFSPKFIDVGYRPKQPIPYSHRLHAGALKMDCRYCHTNVDKSNHAGVPPTQTCMNCHKMVLKNSENLAMLRKSWEANEPIHWVKVHDLPDYVHFPHAPHIHAGVGCQSCHGDVASMEEVWKTEPLSMRWCLDCHRNPAPHLRPDSEIINTKYDSPDRLEIGQAIMKAKNINPPENCTACHY